MRPIHIRVYGDVHGVFFRAFVKEKAQALGLVGFVRNSEESVEIVAEGDGPALQRLLAACRHGPPKAKVLRVEVEEETVRQEFSTFERR